MKKKEGCSSPTRKMLVKKLIKYEETLHELHNYDHKKSVVHSLEGAARHSRSRSPQMATVDSKYVDEPYVDEDYRKLKLDRLRDLMASELSRAESDGTLNFKKDDLEKAYTGYPNFMHTHEAKKESTLGSRHNSAEHHIKRPLIDELKEAYEDAEHLYSDEEIEKVKVLKNSDVQEKKKADGLAFKEEKLYHLELNHHVDYIESPLKNRYDFHQRKSKEIRRLQYNATFEARKFVPNTKNKKSVTEISKPIAKRAPPRIAPLEVKLIRHEIADYRDDSPRKMKNEIDLLAKIYKHRRTLTKMQEIAPRSFPDYLDDDDVVEPKILDPSFLEELKPSQEDNQDKELAHSDHFSNKESEPSAHQDLSPNWGDQQDDKLEEKNRQESDNSEPSEELELEQNKQDADDSAMHSQADNRSEESEPIEEPDLDPGYIDQNDEPKDELSARKSFQSEPSDHELLYKNDQDSNDRPKEDENNEEDDNSEPSIEPGLESNPQDSPDLGVNDEEIMSNNDSEPLEEPRLDPNYYENSESNNESDDRVHVESDDRYYSRDDIYLSDEEALEQPFIPSAKHVYKYEERAYYKKPADPLEKLPLQQAPIVRSKLEKSFYEKFPDQFKVQPSFTSKFTSAEIETTYQRRVPDNVTVPPHFITCLGSIETARKLRPKPIKPQNKAQIFPSPACSCKYERAYYKKLPLKISIDPFFMEIRGRVDCAYKRKLPPIPPRDQRVIFPGECMSKLEKAYYKQVNRPVRLTPSPERYSKDMDQSYIKKVYDMIRTEPSPERLHSSQEFTKFKVANNRPFIPSCSWITKTEDRCYVVRPDERIVCQPLPTPYEQLIEVGKYLKVYKQMPGESSPERYSKVIEFSSYIKPLERSPLEPCPEFKSLIHSCYNTKPQEMCKLEPFVSKFEQRVEATYFQKIQQRQKTNPLYPFIVQRIETAHYYRVYLKPRGVAPAQVIECSLEEFSIHKVYLLKRITPLTIQKIWETMYIYRMILWEGQKDSESEHNKSVADESVAPASEFSSVREGPLSERLSEANHRGSVHKDGFSEDDDEAIEIIPADADGLSNRSDDDDRASIGSEASEGKENTRFGRTNPDEKFPCWILDENNEAKEALLSSPDGFMIDLENGKLQIRSGDKLNIEPANEEKFEEVNSIARKRDPVKDSLCDFIVKDEQGRRCPVILTQQKLPPKVANCTLYDPDDQIVGRAKLRLYETDPETGEEVKYYNAVLVDESNKTSHVLVKQIDEDRILLKRSKECSSEEIIKTEEMVMIDDIPTRLVTLDPFYTQKPREEKLYIPKEAFKVYKSPLIDSEQAQAFVSDDQRIFQGPLLVEPLQAEKSHEVFILIPPENRVNTGKRESIIPRYARVQLDEEILEDQKKFEDFQDRIAIAAAEEEHRQEITSHKVDKKPPVKAKTLQPLATNRLSLLSKDSKAIRKQNEPDENDSADDSDNSGLNCYDSIKDNEDLYYQIDYDEKKAQSASMRHSVLTQQPPKHYEEERKSEKMRLSQPRISNASKPLSLTSSKRGSTKSSQKVVTSQKSAKTEKVAPSLVEGPARIKIDASGEGNKRVHFVGVGKLSDPNNSKPQKKYSRQLSDLKNRAATTIQLYWLYCTSKPERRHMFNMKFKRAKTKLANEKVFRKFLLHFVSLPQNVSVDKALDNYLKVLSKSHK